jgi:hypothetical protein
MIGRGGNGEDYLRTAFIGNADIGQPDPVAGLVNGPHILYEPVVRDMPFPYMMANDFFGRGDGGIVLDILGQVIRKFLRMELPYGEEQDDQQFFHVAVLDLAGMNDAAGFPWGSPAVNVVVQGRIPRRVPRLIK